MLLFEENGIRVQKGGTNRWCFPKKFEKFFRWELNKAWS